MTKLPMTRRPMSRRRFVQGVGGVAVLLPLVSACSSDEATESTGSTAAGAKELTKLTLQASWVNDAEFMGFYVAEDNGYYTDEGIELNYLPGGPDILPESQLLSGQAQIALTSPDTTAKAILEQGAPFKIIAVDFQKSPLGILSLADGANVVEASDLVGKTIATGTSAITPVEALLRANGVDPASVTFVPYSFDPQVLIDGEVDAAADFCPDTPFVIKEQGGDPVCTLLYDLGYEMYNHTLVVTEETLENDRDALIGFLRASQMGWEENFVDPDAYPEKFEDTWFKGTGRSVAQETFFNNQAAALMENPDGFLTLTPSDVDQVVATMNSVGIKATADMFDTTLMEEVNAA